MKIKLSLLFSSQSISFVHFSKKCKNFNTGTKCKKENAVKRTMKTKSKKSALSSVNVQKNVLNKKEYLVFDNAQRQVMEAKNE